MVIVGGIVLLFGIIVGTKQIIAKNEPLLTEAEVKEIVRDRYTGTIQGVELNEAKEMYTLTVENERGLYDVKVHAVSGEIGQLTLVEKKETKPVEKNEPGPKVKEEEAKERALKQVNGKVESVKSTTTEQGSFYEIVIVNDSGKHKVQVNAENAEAKVVETSQPKQVLIDENRAKQIALEQVKGVVEEVELRDENGVKMYKIEIEASSGEDAAVYVNAYTGEFTISWDD